ncbi:hypothetical protein [Actinacidiphila glaucinigra]|uniref:hypothetical protein n=1 Tax=Actinacidiphila glaucinigra TaxID=235986 RepID=UPI00366C30CB
MNDEDGTEADDPATGPGDRAGHAHRPRGRLTVLPRLRRRAALIVGAIAVLMGADGDLVLILHDGGVPAGDTTTVRKA